MSAIRDLFPRKVGRFDALKIQRNEKWSPWKIHLILPQGVPNALPVNLARGEKTRRSQSWQDSVTAALDFGLTSVLQRLASQQLHLRNPDLSFVLRDPTGMPLRRECKISDPVVFFKYSRITFS